MFRRKGKKVWYFYYCEGNHRLSRSTGETLKYRAEEEAQKFLDGSQENQIPLGEYAAPFFTGESCPHVSRLRLEGKSIGDTHIQKCRSWLKEYVLKDRVLVRKPIGSITRADLLDYRNRLIKKLGDKRNTINKAMSTLKVIFKEAYFRQDISFDPTQGIGNLKEDRQEPGIFPKEELKALSPDDSYGPWKDIWDYTCFLVAATTAMRKSEVLALQWADISFENASVALTRAWKTEKVLGAAQVE